MPMILLFSMIFCHIADDYYLQGILASMKQKKWWEEHYPEPVYRHDYVTALLTHAFSWSFMIQLPVMIMLILRGAVTPRITAFFCILFLFNWGIHAFVDHRKANELRLSLTQDQLIHLLQIILTWGIWIMTLNG